MTALQRQIEELTMHRASEWLEILKQGDAGQYAAFIAWVTESPRHLDGFLMLAALQRELPRLDYASRFDIDALLAEVSPAVAELQPASAPRRVMNKPRTPRRRSTVRRWAGVAAGVALGVGAWMVAQETGPRIQIIETALGEQRSIELLDGSLVYVNAQTTLRVHLDDARRDIRLTRGEALFKVTQDAGRPFRVYTQEAVVQALGTEFNVYARPTGTTVAVLEGKVSVSGQHAGQAPTALDAGEAAQIDATGTVQRAAPASIAKATAWRQRRLIFDKTPLEEIVNEFNRYNRSTQLRLEGIEPGSRHYSGHFDADDPESLAALLMREADLLVERRDGNIIVRKFRLHP